ncbi:MAG: RdgB/HAM1 family non-canonical purine NTP pyrophosphatase [Actinomycetota bacterium]|nr:RdgB/HAM1 family non-canonical purine NTP pyrophosphatase [Actinomycetota bacterium]MDA3013785.1 RdgB/HAM1 family non-canonical purine NTP pyrophosphatase [Actinomycetota bacterium]
MKILFASQNNAKKAEISKIFNQFSDKHFLYTEDEVLEVIEDQETIEENAIKKAKEYFEFFKCPVISDDSGLFVEELDGKPGVLSARFAGKNASDRDNIEKLINLMQNRANYAAKFQTVLCFYNGYDLITTFGELHGKIILEPRGTNGFGYDSIFEVNGKTLAELDIEEKSKISHRNIASVKLVKKINEI